MDEDTPVGQRIAYWRRRRGLTQQVLAGRAGCSTSWVSKLERGERTVEKISDLLALARVLKVEPGDLIGGLELPPNGGGPLDPPQGIPAVRRAVLVERAPDREPPDAAELRAAADQADRLVGSGSYRALAFHLPHLFASARSAVAQEVPGAWSCLARTYRVASILARDVGERELACVAADRGIAAARRSGDAVLVASSVRSLGHALMAQGWLDDAGAVCSDAADELAPTDDAPLEAWALWGSLRLNEGIIAVRGADVADAWRALREARAAAERVGEGRNDYWEAFGPANVSAHEIAVALEAGDAVEALRRADGLDVEALPVAARRARVLIDVAQAHELRRDDGSAVAVLLEAECHAPEVVRYNVLARELVRVCLGRERRSRTPGLRGLAERIGVAVDAPGVPHRP
ncbi:MAG: helix-turn-helix domain-containing protein [Egibacteraceae bacterium]